MNQFISAEAFSMLLDERKSVGQKTDGGLTIQELQDCYLYLLQQSNRTTPLDFTFLKKSILSL